MTTVDNMTSDSKNNSYYNTDKSDEYYIDDVYFSKSEKRVIPIMTSTASDGCKIIGPDPGNCNGGAQSPWDSSGTEDGTGCWSFHTHSMYLYL